MPSALPITQVFLYKHGVGYFEREGPVEGDATLELTFKQAEVSDVLKSLTILDLNGGHVASVSYDATRPLAQLLAEVALSIPDENSLVGLLPQIKGARLAVQPAGGGAIGMRGGGGGERVEGTLLGVDFPQRQTAEGVVKAAQIALVTDAGAVRTFDLAGLTALEILDDAVRRDLDFYLKTQLAAKKKDRRTFTFFARGEGKRSVRLSYVLEAPVWKATYRVLLGEDGKPPLIQGWAVVDNTQDEDWENVQLSLIAGLPVSFVHDLYTPRYVRRPEVRVQETTGVLPPAVEEGVEALALTLDEPATDFEAAPAVGASLHSRLQRVRAAAPARAAYRESLAASAPAQVRERQVGDLFEYAIEHPVTIRRNQSALVPIVLRDFAGRPVLLYNQATRAENPLRCVEFKNTTGLTLEGGPVTVLEGGTYVGEAMLETTKPDDTRLLPFAVELGVFALTNVDSHEETVSRVIIRHGTLTAFWGRVRQTTYTLNNKGDAGQTVYLDHPREGGDWELFDTPAAHEVTANHWRFQFALPARRVTAFVVRQRQPLQQSNALSQANDAQLALWVDRKYLDAATAQALRQALDLARQANGHQVRLNQLDKERSAVHAEQKRIRENLQALGDRPADKELRERYLRTLNAQEDRLEAMDREAQEATAARDRGREQMNALLERLEYEAALGG
jgi:hypothetical protein